MIDLIIKGLIFYLIVKAARHRRFLYICLVTLPRDLYAAVLFIYVNIFLLYIKHTDQTTVKYFDAQVCKRKGKVCFYFENDVWTYEQVQEESYKVANYFQDLGYKKGDVVALIMQNRPEYVFTWLGLSRIGVITSLVNYNIRLKSLEHCVAVANSKAIIFGTEMTPVIQEVVDSGGFQELELFSLEDRKSPTAIAPGLNLVNRSVINLTEELKVTSSHPSKSHTSLHNTDVVLLVYTSGTTGLPKASLLRHSRVFSMSCTTMAAGIKAGKDILITPVPLYHVQGGVIGVSAALCHGVPQVIVRKFSASRFWSECIRYEATASQYLGEIIRYLYNQPEKPEDKLHQVQTFFGNGVNPAVWEKFVKRFHNVKIKEIYGATEGNCNLMNVVGHVGACGFLPIWSLSFMPYFFAKVDDASGEIKRNEMGLAIHEDFGKAGELLGKISQSPMRQFDGYTDEEATKKKIVRNIRTQGDEWFRTGDLIVLDEYGYWYFKDRMGDTYRFKGENVSTAEVEEIVTRGAGMKATVVYGVIVPGSEGKCGMAAIADPEENLDLAALTLEINRSLPTYARPLFLRVIKHEMNMTGTFKLQKGDLQKEAVDMKKIKDAIYVLKEGVYIPLSEELYQELTSGKMRF